MRSYAVKLVAQSRNYARAAHRRFVLDRALDELRRDPERCLQPTSKVLTRLTYGWGNEGWSGSEDFLRGCIREALLTNGPILECGSGLSTLIAGIVAERRGIPVIALEHIDAWRERVTREVRRLGLRRVRVCRAPLEHFGDYCWYQMPQETCGVVFALVLCDGPPGTTPGGRYGLLPRARSMIGDRCVILLDDAARAEEQAVARRWVSEAALACETIRGPRPYFRFVHRVEPHPG